MIAVPITAIVVTYNSADTLPRLVASLRAGTLVPRIVVVDNASSDGSAAVARELGVEVVEAGGNLGYSGGINVGRAHAGPGQAILILNPDLTVAPDAVERMRDTMVRTGAGVVAPMVRNADGSRYNGLRREPTVLGALGEALLGERAPRRPRVTLETLRRDEDYDHVHAVGWACGAALLVAPGCDAAVGDWDAERFFLYAEEVDYQRRVRDAGYRVMFEPAAVVHHSGGASGSSPALHALLAVNRVRYVAKHGGPARAAAYRAAVLLQYLLRAPARRELRPAVAALADRRRWSRLPHATRAEIRTEHVLVTRFNLPSPGFERSLREREGWLTGRVALFERYCLPSVLAQSCPDFHWIVYLDAASPAWLKDKMSHWQDEGVLHPVYLDHDRFGLDLPGRLRALLPGHRGRVITTNLDNDDALAVDFVARLRAVEPAGTPTAVYFANGLIATGSRLYLRRERDNAFCSVVADADRLTTFAIDWHNRLARHMPILNLPGSPAWLQLVHDANVSNRVHGRLVAPDRYRASFPTLSPAVAAPALGALLADRLVAGPGRAVRELGRASAKALVVGLLGHDRLDSVKLTARRAVGAVTGAARAVDALRGGSRP